MDQVDEARKPRAIVACERSLRHDDLRAGREVRQMDAGVRETQPLTSWDRFDQECAPRGSTCVSGDLRLPYQRKKAYAQTRRPSIVKRVIENGFGGNRVNPGENNVEAYILRSSSNNTVYHLSNTSSTACLRQESTWADSLLW